jgi:hypothetical protein
LRDDLKPGTCPRIAKIIEMKNLACPLNSKLEERSVEFGARRPGSPKRWKTLPGG